MTCSVYPSRTTRLLGVAAVLLLAAWASLVLPRADLPPAVRVGSGAFLAAALLACLIGLLTRKPLLRVDDTGIAYHPKQFPKIAWDDVLDVERAPLIEPTPDGLIYHLKDDWRPVNIYVVGSDKYLRHLPAALRQRQSVDESSDAVRFQFAFVGRSSTSAEVYECIRRHLDGRGTNA